MTDVGVFGPHPFPAAKPAPEAPPMERPTVQPLAAPVFIYDCVTPLGGETLLSLLMKKMAERDHP